MCVCLHMCKHLWRPEQGVGFHEAVVTGDCEPPTWALGTGPWVLCKRISTVEPSLQPQEGDALTMQTTIPNKEGVKSTAQEITRIFAHCSCWPKGWISSFTVALRWEHRERATLLVLMKVHEYWCKGNNLTHRSMFKYWIQKTRTIDMCVYACKCMYMRM